MVEIKMKSARDQAKELGEAWRHFVATVIREFKLVELCQWFKDNCPFQRCWECGKWHWAGLPRWEFPGLLRSIFSRHPWHCQKTWEPRWNEFCSFRCADRELVRVFGPKHPHTVAEKSFEPPPGMFSVLDKFPADVKSVDEAFERIRPKQEVMPERWFCCHACDLEFAAIPSDYNHCPRCDSPNTHQQPE